MHIRQRVARQRGRLSTTLGQNLMSLYGLHIFTYVIPLLTTPYLARTLGPEIWGLVAFAQVIGLNIGLVIEYGFNFSATREVARHRHDMDRQADIMAGVMGAKFLILVLILPLVWLVAPWIPHLQDHPTLLWISVVAAIARSFNVVWFFQGHERMKTVVSLNVVTNILATVGIFTLVRTPDDGPIVLGLHAVAAMTGLAVSLYLVRRELPFRRPRFSVARESLQQGWSMFLFRASTSLYTSTTLILLGFFVPAQAIGYYVGADKISKAMGGLLVPASQALFPRISHLVREAPLSAARLAMTSIRVMSAVAAGMAIGTIVFAPMFTHILLGSEFGSSVAILRILAFSFPLVAISAVLGMQWMIPLGMDRTINTITIGAGAVNITLALFLTPQFGGIGLASGVVVTELLVTGAMYLRLRSKRLDPGSLIHVKALEAV